MKLRRLFLVLLVLCLTLGAIALCASAATIVDSGKCGENVTWKLDSEGTLTISGTGDMDDYEYDDLGESVAPWTDSKVPVKKVIIKDGVTSIGDYAFIYKASMANVTIPDSVTRIGYRAFCMCENLQSVSIPDSVISIGAFAFSDCSNLSSATIGGSATSIGKEAFSYCYNLETVTIGEGVTTIGEAAFTRCENLSSIIIPDSVTSIGFRAFSNCTNLTSATIGGRVASIGGEVFSSCADLETVVIKEGVTSIGTSMFSSCGDLSSITIPGSVTSIGSRAFANCDLTTIVFCGNAPKLGDGAFSRVAADVYYPANDSTWKASVKQNYGGTINWIEKIPLTITTQPKTTYTYLGGKTNVSVVAEGNGLTYTWYYKNVDGSKFFKSKITSPTYSVTMNNKYKDRYVYCVITDIFGNTVKSDTVRLRMAATITQQPVNTSAPKGEKATVTIAAAGDGLTYQWYYKDVDDAKYQASSFKGATYSTKMTTGKDGRQIYCVVKDKYGNTAKSNVVKLGIPAKITKQPVTAYAKNGAKVKTSVTATGQDLTYTWYYKNVGAAKYSKSSITSSTYSITMSSKYKDRYVYCVITDAFGNTVKTNVVRLRMTASITAQPKSVSAEKGTKAKATVTAMGDGLTYQWYYKDVKSDKYQLSSMTGKTYSTTMTAARDGRKVYCVVTDKYGNSVKSNVVTLSVK